MKHWLFHQIQRRYLVHNQCWEDPSIDRRALNITHTDSIVAITSAGCNALDYLLTGPRRIDCVDVNRHQTALLDLKLAAIQALPHERFFQMFGEGRIRGHRQLYGKRLRPLLRFASRRVWDRNIDYFSINGPGLYYHGTSGFLARALNAYVRSRGLRGELDALQTIDNLHDQAALYREKIAPRLWTEPVLWLLRHQVILSLLGIPSAQVSGNPRSEDVSGFIRERVDRVFTSIPLKDNYFWRVYMNGRYTRDCCPNYLRPDVFELLREYRPRIHTHTMSLTDFLRFADMRFSIYVLLDHMDWLTSSEDTLRDEWRAILRTADTGARIIYRSRASHSIAFPNLRGAGSNSSRTLRLRSTCVIAWEPMDRSTWRACTPEVGFAHKVAIACFSAVGAL